MPRKAMLLLILLAALIAGFSIGRRSSSAGAVSKRHVLYYVDPMHPSYRSSKPGIAPDCGMQLTPVYAQDLAGTGTGAASPATGLIHIGASTRQLYGIHLLPVEEGLCHPSVRVYGRVAADETRTFRVNLGTEGYVKGTVNDAVGNHVVKDQRIATIYSPEFLAVVGGYLSANERTTGTNGKDTAAQMQNTASAQARADRLRNLGMSDVQIDEIAESHKIPEDVYIVSPTDGFIVARDISPGERFEKHAELYRIADLSHVWILGEAFGADASAFHPGTLARITLHDTGETFTARVSSVLPSLDPATRALQPRLELANPGFRLRPGMFVDIDIPSRGRDGLTVPASAIVDTGLAKRVFVEDAEGNLASREVQTGSSCGDRVQVVGGLKSGEQVVSSGTFLVDSESRMQLPSARN